MRILRGEKKPKMPPAFSKKRILPLKILCNQAITVSTSKYLDFRLVKDMVIQISVPGFAGYNTKQMRESGQSTKPKTKAIYKPLINKTPSDSSTILTAMCDIETTCKKSGQKEAVFSQLAKHWIKNLIYPVFLMMMYMLAEREIEFDLHLYCCKTMIPYFFPAGHWNYAQDSIVY